MSEPKDQTEAACGGSALTAELGDYNPLLPAFEAMRKDAERYRWLRNYRPGLILDMLDDHEIQCDQWAANLDQAIDARRAVPNA